jgi:hypothetical protein
MLWWMLAGLQINRSAAVAATASSWISFWPNLQINAVSARMHVGPVAATCSWPWLFSVLLTQDLVGMGHAPVQAYYSNTGCKPAEPAQLRSPGQQPH